MIAFKKMNEHHAIRIAMVAMRQATAMSRRGVIKDKSQDMGEPPRCWEKDNRQDKICIKTNDKTKGCA